MISDSDTRLPPGDAEAGGDRATAAGSCADDGGTPPPAAATATTAEAGAVPGRVVAGCGGAASGVPASTAAAATAGATVAGANAAVVGGTLPAATAVVVTASDAAAAGSAGTTSTIAAGVAGASGNGGGGSAGCVGTESPMLVLLVLATVLVGCAGGGGGGGVGVGTCGDAVTTRTAVRGGASAMVASPPAANSRSGESRDTARDAMAGVTDIDADAGGRMDAPAARGHTAAAGRCASGLSAEGNAVDSTTPMVTVVVMGPAAAAGINTPAPPARPTTEPRRDTVEPRRLRTIAAACACSGDIGIPTASPPPAALWSAPPAAGPSSASSPMSKSSQRENEVADPQLDTARERIIPVEGPSALASMLSTRPVVDDRRAAGAAPSAARGVSGSSFASRIASSSRITLDAMYTVYARKQGAHGQRIAELTCARKNAQL